jgi:hypothetical protein
MNKTIKLLAFVFGSIALILVLGIVFVNVWSEKQTDNPSSQTNQHLEATAADTQRKNSVGTIWGAVQEYHQKTGKYPLNEELNSPAFQTAYRLSADVLTDPQGQSAIVTTLPTKNTYSYSPKAADGSACNNVEKLCIKFKVTALLNAGTEYSLTETQ